MELTSKNDKIEEENKERMKNLSQRRQNLEHDMRSTARVLEVSFLVVVLSATPKLCLLILLLPWQPWLMKLKDEIKKVLRDLNQLSASQMMQAPFMEKLIDLLTNSRGDGAVEAMARKIVNYRSGGERASEFTQKDFERETETMDMELLTDVFQAVVVVQETAGYFERERTFLHETGLSAYDAGFTAYPYQSPHSKNLGNTDVSQLLRLLTNREQFLLRIVEEEMEGTKLGMLQKHAPFTMTAEDKLRKELHKRLEHISQSRLEIIDDFVKILKRNRCREVRLQEYHRSMYHMMHVPLHCVEEERHLPLRYTQTPVHGEDFSEFTNFLSALNGKEDPAKAPVALKTTVSTPISVLRKSIEELEQERRAKMEEDQRKKRVEYEKELKAKKRIAEEKFERELKDQKSRNDQKENQMRVKTEQLNQKASSEFDERLKRQTVQHEENLRKAREENETFENLTVSGMELATKNDKIEEERKERMKNLSQRRENLELDMRSTQSALETVSKARESSEDVNAFNDSIEILREFKEDVFTKFLDVSETLHTVMDGKEKVVAAKRGLDSLKSLILKTEVHLRNVQEKWVGLIESEKLESLNQAISSVKKWIDFFLKMTTMKTVTAWNEDHVEILKRAINKLMDAIDDINYVTSNLNESIGKLAIGVATQLQLK